MKRIISAILATALLVSTFAGCQASTSASGSGTGTATASTGAAANSTAASSGQVLNVGMMPFTVNVPAQYAYEKGWFKDAGLNVKFVMFQNGTPMNESLSAGQLDVGVAGTAAVFSMANDISTLVYESNTAGGMGLYVRKDSPIAKVKGQLADNPDVLGSKDTIKGIKVLGSLGTVSQYVAISYAQKFGLKETDIQQVSMDFAQALQAFKTGQGDAISVPPPYSFQAEAAGAVKAISFEQASGMKMKDGILARKAVLKDRKADVVKFIQVYEKACEALAKDKNERHTFSMKFFKDNGLVYTDKMMDDEIAVRDYITKEDYKKSGYTLGDSYMLLANFFSGAGKIEKDLLPNVPKNFDSSVIEEAFGIKVNTAK
jgi:ABC-type nitrate/sulfonate/bicarbonate transport system substrate-binding protein